MRYPDALAWECHACGADCYAEHDDSIVWQPECHECGTRPPEDDYYHPDYDDRRVLR